jgi:hypothetical protein
LTAVKRAVRYAVKQRWVLSDETDAIVAAAEEKAAQHPSCIPTG